MSPSPDSMLRGPCPHLGDRLWLDRCSRADRGIPTWFRILGIVRTAHGWALLRGYPIHRPDASAPIGRPCVVVVFLPRTSECVHGW